MGPMGRLRLHPAQGHRPQEHPVGPPWAEPGGPTLGHMLGVYARRGLHGQMGGMGPCACIFTIISEFNNYK